MTVRELKEELKDADDDMNVWLITNAGVPEQTEPDIIINAKGGPYDSGACVVIMPGEGRKYGRRMACSKEQ